MEVDPTRFLAEENSKLRKAGCDLAIAAIRVARDYDGVHRLMLAVTAWTQAIADEGGRPHGKPKTKPETDDKY